MFQLFLLLCMSGKDVRGVVVTSAQLDSRPFVSRYMVGSNLCYCHAVDFPSVSIRSLAASVCKGWMYFA